MSFSKMRCGVVAMLLAGVATTSSSLGGGVNPEWSIARQWDEEILQAIRIATPRPPVHARNLYHTSAAMYDAWATYDTTARGVFFLEKHTADDIEAARRETISYAAYRVLKARFVAGNGPNVAQIQANLDSLFAQLGYDKNNTSTVGNSPAAIGNRIASVILAAGLADGSNEQGNYAANNGYHPVNPSMPFKIPGCVMNNASHWQPLAFDFLVLQNGEIIGASIQTAICPHWANVKTFGLFSSDRNATSQVYFDQGPPPQFGSATFKEMAIDMIAKSAALDARLEDTIDISPAVYHNSPLGTYEHLGYGLNPVTGEPYEPNVVKVADYTRILAEWWADGPDSETPPGHWHVVANDVSDTPNFEFRIGGDGEPVSRLEWDVKMYLSVAGACHDAAITAWGAKGYYDSARPISFVRYLCETGQSSNASAPNYSPNGMPLVPGLIEQVTEADVAPGGRFEDFPELVYEPLFGIPIGVNTHVGDIAVYAWTGGFSAGATTGSTTTGPLPGHVYRGKGNTWKIGDYEPGVNDTPGTLNAGQPRAPRSIQINEIRVDQPGRDKDEYVEIAGPAGASLNGLTYLVVGDEVQTKVPDSQGRVQVAISLDGKQIGPNGTFVIAKNAFSLGTANLTQHFRFLEIGNCTHMLVSGFSGAIGDDLDFIDNGEIDFEPWTAVVDAIGLRRNQAAVGIYASTTLGPIDSKTASFGVDWSLGDRWMPYQASNFVTPPFPGYISGHSTFSRSAAEALTRFTGSPFFPGGFREEVVDAGWLRFEKGPLAPVKLQWATYYDAADEAGVSRIWGGIHPYADDLPARVIGSTVGARAATRALALYGGLAFSPDMNSDGLVDPVDLGILLGAWGGNSTTGADLNGDGTVGPEDLGILLGAWTF
jgi:hypothetical protein